MAMKLNARLLVWLSAALLATGVAQQPPSNKAVVAGLNLTLQACNLSGDVLTCTVEVQNPQDKTITLSINANSVQALTASGWLYLGQASASSLKLAPKGKATLKLTFRGVNTPSALFAMIQVGDARFRGVVVPGSLQLAAKEGYCLFYQGWSDGLVCHLARANETDTDITLRVDPRESFVISDVGARYMGTRVVLGQTLYDYNATVDLTVPAHTTTRVGVMFVEGGLSKLSYRPEQVQMVRFKVSGGFLELRNVPVRYCGTDANEACTSLQPF
ncbi:hypothetical protein Thermus77927_18340 [Thermus hydrothermalis]